MEKEISLLRNQSGLVVDENMKVDASSTDDCLVLQLRKNEKNNSKLALLTTKNCKQKAKFWCSIDATEIETLDSEGSPDLACLLSNNTSSTNANQERRRRKRETENVMEKEDVERADANKAGDYVMKTIDCYSSRWCIILSEINLICTSFLKFDFQI